MESTLPMNTTRKDDNAARQRKRNIAVALILAGLVVLFYVITIVHMGGNVFNRPL